MNFLKDFYAEERKRVLTPDPFFTQRVMAQLDERSAEEPGLWEVASGSTRPTLSLALMLILCFMLAEMWVPAVPQRDFAEAFLESEQSPEEGLLYGEVDLPRDEEFLEQVMLLEGQQ